MSPVYHCRRQCHKKPCWPSHSNTRLLKNAGNSHLIRLPPAKATVSEDMLHRYGELFKAQALFPFGVFVQDAKSQPAMPIKWRLAVACLPNQSVRHHKKGADRMYRTDSEPKGVVGGIKTQKQDLGPHSCTVCSSISSACPFAHKCATRHAASIRRTLQSSGAFSFRSVRSGCEIATSYADQMASGCGLFAQSHSLHAAM